MVYIPEGVEKFHYSWEQLDADVEETARAIESSGRQFTHIYGIPRGGYTLAVCLSHRLNLRFADVSRKFMSDQMTVEDFMEVEPGIWTMQNVPLEKILIVDDIADTGRQLQPYRDAGFSIATLFYHKQSTVVPDIWLHEKKEQWIVFPWEKEPL